MFLRRFVWARYKGGVDHVSLFLVARWRIAEEAGTYRVALWSERKGIGLVNASQSLA